MPASTLTFSTITTEAGLAALLPEWTCLFQRAATANPFAHPLWLTTWARHFIRPSQLYVIAVRDGDELVGVAPFYRWRHALAPGLSVTQLQLMCTGQHVELTELPQVLVRPGLEREALRGIMHYLGERAGEWDWVEVVLAPQQGWFEPEWLPQSGPGAGSYRLHKATRACVVLPLPGSWEELRAGMKRNVKESIRRGANSLKRAGHSWNIEAPANAVELDAVLDQIVALHGARSTIEGKVRHADYFSDPADLAFLRDAARRMFDAGLATPCLLRIDGAPAAGRLLLHANGATFCSFSGFAPAWWPYNVATTLLAEALRLAMERGDRLVNLSSGPDVAKLRWSERLELSQEFIMVGPRRRSRLAFALFWQLRNAALLRREGHRFDLN